MTDDRENQIREQAYALWEKEGSPWGRDVEFWERARLLVDAPEVAPTIGTPDSAADREVDVAMEETFPASDPPAFTADRGTMTS